MTAFLDTNIVVRYLTGDPPNMARRAAKVIDTTNELLVTDVVLMETAYVLMENYHVPSERVMDLLAALITRHNVSVFALDKTLVLEALELCRPSGRISIPGALVWAAARSEPSPVIYTFDQRFPAEGVDRRLI